MGICEITVIISFKKVIDIEVWGDWIKWDQQIIEV